MVPYDLNSVGRMVADRSPRPQAGYLSPMALPTSDPGGWLKWTSLSCRNVAPAAHSAPAARCQWPRPPAGGWECAPRRAPASMACSAGRRVAPPSSKVGARPLHRTPTRRPCACPPSRGCAGAVASGCPKSAASRCQNALRAARRPAAQFRRGGTGVRTFSDWRDPGTTRDAGPFLRHRPERRRK